MTRERAIEVLKAWDLNCSDEFTANEFEQAFAMAIKALEQEPFINKPCVSSGVCEHDKQKILDKIRAEIRRNNMADIELVIKIPEEIYKASQIIDAKYEDVVQIPLEVIKNGTPLPKGHGDLIDRSKIYKAIYAEEDNCTGMGMTYDEMCAYNDGIDAMYDLVQGAKPIIEAESEGKE